MVLRQDEARLRRPECGADMTPMAKLRADQMLVDRGLAESRTRAQALIMAGLVFAGDTQGRQARPDARRRRRCSTSAAAIIPGCRAAGSSWRMRLQHFGWDVTGAVAIDVGSSTGGFTDVLLDATARRASTRSTAAPTSSPGSCARTRASIVHEQTSARILTPDAYPRTRRPDRLRRELHRPRQGARARRWRSRGRARGCSR